MQAHPCSFGDVVCAWVRLPLCLCCSLTPCMRARIATVLGCLHVVLCLCVCERKRELSFVRWCSRLVCKSWPKSFVISVVCSVYPLISLCLTCAFLCHPCSYTATCVFSVSVLASLQRRSQMRPRTQMTVSTWGIQERQAASAEGDVPDG